MAGCLSPPLLAAAAPLLLSLLPGVNYVGGCLPNCRQTADPTDHLGNREWQRRDGLTLLLIRRIGRSRAVDNPSPMAV